jgi:hypothetical protein
MNDPLERSCPECKLGNVVERRNKKTGQPFYGCSRYPECKFAVADLARLAPSGPAPASLVYGSNHGELVAAVRELAEAITSLASRLGPSSNISTKEEPEARDHSAFSSYKSSEGRP